MASPALCDPYVWEDPRYIFRFTWLQNLLGRRKGGCVSEIVNEIVFIYVFAVLAGAAAGVLLEMPSAVILAGILATLWLIPAFLKLRAITEGYKNAGSTEGFASGPAGPDPEANDIGVEASSAATVGNSKNPFNNVLIDEIKYAPTRPEAPDITTPEAKVALDDYFRVQWYSDPTDVFGKNQSQREFVSQPVTTIPNDQESYQNWLYRIPGKTCKEGNPEMCYGGTNGAALPWLNM